MAEEPERSKARALEQGAAASVAGVESRIYALRGCRVMLSTDLAQLYEVETRVLMQAVRRNLGRFPADFMFELTRDEAGILKSRSVILDESASDASRSQIVTLKKSQAGGQRGTNIKYLPFAFTEQGVAMLSSVLRSDRAIAVNIEIMRTFVKLRSMLESNKDLAKKLSSLEAKYNDQFRIVFDAIRELMNPPIVPKRRIGFIED